MNVKFFKTIIAQIPIIVLLMLPSCNNEYESVDQSSTPTAIEITTDSFVFHSNESIQIPLSITPAQYLLAKDDILVGIAYEDEEDYYGYVEPNINEYPPFVYQFYSFNLIETDISGSWIVEIAIDDYKFQEDTDIIIAIKYKDKIGNSNFLISNKANITR